MAREWGLAAGTGLGNLIDAYQRGKTFRLAQDTGELQNKERVNQDKENTAKFGAEFGAEPQYDEKDPFKFKGFGLPQNPADQQVAARQLKANFGQDADKSGSWEQPSGQSAMPQPDVQLTPSGRPMYAPGKAPSLAPDQTPGDPKPLLRDHKAEADLIKTGVGAPVQDQAGSQGKGVVVGQGPDGKNIRVLNDPTSVEGSGMSIPVGEGEQAPPQDMSLFLRNSLLKQSTAVPRIKFDENVNVDSLSPDMKKRLNIPEDQHGNVPLSLLQGGQKGNFANQAATIRAMAMGIDPQDSDILSMVDNGAGIGQAAQAWSQKNPGKIMPPGLMRGLRQAASQFNQGASRDQRGALSAQTQVNNNPILRTYKQRVDGADRILSLIDATEKSPDDKAFVASTREILNQAQNEVARLEVGGQALAHAGVEDVSMKDYGATLQSLQDAISGSVTPVDLRAKLKQIKAQIGVFRNDYANNISSQMKLMGAGALPNQQGVFKAKEDALNEAVAPGQHNYAAEAADAQARLSKLSGPDRRVRAQKYDEYLKGKYGKGLNAQ